MPHCVLEYSSNLRNLPDLPGLLTDINRYLAGTGLFSLGDIKTRAVGHEISMVGDDPDTAFLTLTIAILHGRDDETKARLAEGVQELLKKSLGEKPSGRTCSVTVQIQDIHRGSYQRTWL